MHKTKLRLLTIAVATLIPAGLSSAQTPSLDVVGIRVGMSPQEAYDLLKARAKGARIGVGQFAVAGVTDKPVPTLMSVQIVSDPGEIITVWLTMPPSKQVVWAVGRVVEYQQDKPILKSTVLAGLRQKYGPETNEQAHFWAFDDQGRRIDTAGRPEVNCAGRANWTLAIAPPQDATYAAFTPLLYAPGQKQECDSITEVRTSMDSPKGPDYVTRISVILSDRALARRSQEAYQAFLANAGAAKQQQDLNKAKQQKGPEF